MTSVEAALATQVSIAKVAYRRIWLEPCLQATACILHKVTEKSGSLIVGQNCLLVQPFLVCLPHILLQMRISLCLLLGYATSMVFAMSGQQRVYCLHGSRVLPCDVSGPSRLQTLKCLRNTRFTNVHPGSIMLSDGIRTEQYVEQWRGGV